MLISRVKRVIASALVIGLAAIIAPANSATIAGTKCAKVGTSKTISNIKFTCVKQGSKLVWNKGLPIKSVIIPIPMPSPSASASPTTSSSPTSTENTSAVFTPWATNVNAKVLSDAAQAEFKKWLNIYKPAQSNHKVIIQDGLPQNRLKSFLAADQLGSRLFSNFVLNGSVTVIGKNEEWVVKKLNENGGHYSSCRYNAGNESMDYCLTPLDGTLGIIINNEISFEPQNPSKDGSSLLAHEYFHIAQTGMLRTPATGEKKLSDQDASKWVPVWLLEGSANFVGFSEVFHLNNSNYWDGYEAMLGYAPQDQPINKNLMEDYEVRTCCGNDKPTYPYIIGQIATEYLVASIGMENFLNLWIEYAKYGDFETTFKKVTGISKETFYGNMERLRPNVNLPKVTWKLSCDHGVIVNKEISKLSAEEVAKKFVPNDCQPGLIPTNTEDAQSTSNQIQSDNSNNADNLLGKACTNLGEEKTTFYLWVCVNEKARGKIWIRKGTESQYDLVK